MSGKTRSTGRSHATSDDQLGDLPQVLHPYLGDEEPEARAEDPALKGSGEDPRDASVEVGHDEPALGEQETVLRREPVPARDIDNDVEPFRPERDRLPGIVDDRVRAETSGQLENTGTGHRRDTCPERLGDLDGEGAHFTTGPGDQHRATRSHLPVVAQRLKRGDGRNP